MGRKKGMTKRRKREDKGKKEGKENGKKGVEEGKKMLRKSGKGNERERKRGNRCNLGAVIFYGRTFYYCGWTNLGNVMTYIKLGGVRGV